MFFGQPMSTLGQNLLGRAGWLERPSTTRRTIIWTSPTGAIYTTRPAGGMQFPGWDTTTAALPPPRQTPNGQTPEHPAVAQACPPVGARVRNNGTRASWPSVRSTIRSSPNPIGPRPSSAEFETCCG